MHDFCYLGISLGWYEFLKNDFVKTNCIKVDICKTSANYKDNTDEDDDNGHSNSNHHGQAQECRTQ